ncbi:MAG: hypothetical protein M1445_03240 [Bacteroidetes bacterium]|nr:hypothetical protein [Bacteroidota bacterium]MCL4481629.1 hypothetical protein [Bacteroidota bacterium]MCL6103171.1 hypothetical protein [Bacteroidota bacterium]
MVALEDFFTKTMPNNHPVLWWGTLILGISLILWGLISLFKRMRVSPTKGRKLTLKERLSRRKVQILLTGNKSRRPDYVTIAIQNYGIRPVDLQAPLLVFKRWNSERKFRINSFGGVDDFPMWLEPGYEATYDIDLDQFYYRVPALRRACRLSAEMREVSGKKFVSQTIRIKLI